MRSRCIGGVLEAGYSCADFGIWRNGIGKVHRLGITGFEERKWQCCGVAGSSSLGDGVCIEQ